MNQVIFFKFQEQIEDHVKNRCLSYEDPSHDILHIDRVVLTAQELAIKENADLNIVLPAAYLHDYINLPKNDSQRHLASQLSADEAIQFLKTISYPEKYLADIHHAIAAHSFSAQIEPKTTEAKVVQDADRLDSLGAVGIARCFAISGLLKRQFYSHIDPFNKSREPNDKQFTLDHFYTKLLNVSSALKTKAAQIEGQKRLQFMNTFLTQLESEIARSHNNR